MEDDDASVRLPLCNPTLVQWNEVANVICNQNTACLTGRLQLGFIVNATQPKLNRCPGVYTVLSQSFRQSMSLTILIQLDLNAAHSRSRLRGSLGMRRLRTHPILPLDFDVYFLGVHQCVRNRSIYLRERYSFKFFEDLFRITPMEEPTVNRTYRNPLAGEARTASAGAGRLYDKLADFHMRTLP
jgi:hypothetical protein